MKQVRGYIFSREFMGERVPQHVQNLVIREYCKRNDLHYLLSATEYSMEGSHLIFQQVLDELASIDGIALYSLFQLPMDKKSRLNVYNFTISQKKSLHFSVEGLHVTNEKDILRIEDIWDVKLALPKYFSVL